MNNYSIAEVFSGIADLQEVEGENQFKIRAYRNAARTIRALTESLEAVAERGSLRDIPGIGEAIEAKIREILATGTCRHYEELKERVPAGLVELLRIPGFGAAKVQAAWQELGVTDLDSLEAAAQTGSIRSLPGMGERSEESLLEAIAAHRVRRRVTPIFIADHAARLFAETLRETGSFHRVEVTGEIRRMKDRVQRIELAAAADSESAAVDALNAILDVREVFPEPGGRITVWLRSGRDLLLHLSSPEAFGALMIRTTGSPEHIEKLLARPKREEREASSGDPDSSLVAVEGEIYAARGLPWIPAEVREDRGEIEAAERGELPTLISASDFKGILHAHSTWSDGLASLRDMAAAAREAGYVYHGCTDHSKALGITRGLDEVRLRAQMAEIDALNAELGGNPLLLKGIECDILPDGTLDLSLEVLDELDIVVASVHTQQRMDEETMTARILRALESGVVDILGHPTGRLLGARDPYPVAMERIFDAAVEHSVALEINAAQDRLDLSGEYAFQARERGIPMSVNTDAHRPELLTALRFGIGQARRAWLTPDDVLNAWSVDRLLGWLRHRR